MNTTFKQVINESFEKTFNYRIKFAGDVTNEGIKQLENILGKYGVQSVSSAKRTPIQEEPLDFKNKKLKGPTEVTSVDVVLQYPINERLLEVWVAVITGLSGSVFTFQRITPDTGNGDADGSGVYAEFRQIDASKITRNIEAVQKLINTGRVQAGSQYAALESAVIYTTDLTTCSSRNRQLLQHQFKLNAFVFSFFLCQRFHINLSF